MRRRVEFRLGQSDRDNELWERIQADKRAGVNISGRIKELLSAYYSGELDRFNLPGQPAASAEIDRRARAAAKLRTVTFKSLDRKGDHGR